MKKKRNGRIVWLKNSPRNLFRMMKLTFLLCVLFVSSLSATVSSQQRLSMQLGETGLKSVFKEIQRQTNKTVIYNDDRLMLDQKVKADFKNVKLEDLLEQILSDRGMSYKFMNEYIVIVPETKQPGTQAVEEKVIQGTVSDKGGHLLPGVTVMIKGTNIGVATDQNGGFHLRVADIRDLVLVFSFVGMKSVEMKYAGESDLKVTLEEDAAQMDEVVVTGYQTVKRTRMTGATEVMTAAEIANKGYTTIDQALRGQLAGVSTMSVSGRPGADAQIRIRGINSLSGTSDPIWIVDGMPLQGDLPEVGGSADLQNTVLTSGVGNISPDDIASITILKDAAATAIYGSRAANGVIVITTKRGTAGRSVINIQSNVSVQMAPKSRLDMMNTDEKIAFETSLYNDFPQISVYGRIFKLFKDRDNGVITANAANQELARLSSINTNWYDEIFRTALAQNHTVSLSGGDERTQYYVSLNYNKEKGVLLNNTYDRLTGNIKLTHDFNRRLRLYVDLGTTLKNDRISASAINPLQYATFANPYERPYTEDGEYDYDRTWNTALSKIKDGYMYDINIIQELNDNTQKTRYTSNQINLKLEYQFFDGLMYAFQGTLSNTASHSKKEIMAGSYTSKATSWATQIYPEMELPDNMNKGSLEEQTSRSQSWTLRNTLQYTKNFADSHYITAMVGQEATNKKYNSFSNFSPEYFAPYALIGFPELNGIDAGKLDFERLGSSAESQDRSVSFFMTASYSYKDRYVVSGSYRLDGADIIGKNNRFSPLWNISGKWNVYEEEFMKSIPWISRLSLRGSFGYTGSIDRTAYPFTLLAYNSTRLYKGDKVPTHITPGNPSIKWQKKTDRSLGLDFAFLDERIYGTVNYYNNDTKDLLDNAEIPISSGRSRVKANVASLKNRGWEFSLTTINVKTDDFSWSTSFNMALNHNRISNAYYKSVDDLPVISRTNRTQSYYVTGQPVQAWYGFKFAGVDPATGHTLAWVDRPEDDGTWAGHLQPNGKHILDMDTEANTTAISFLGEGYPPLSGGWGTNINYKRISLAAQFSFMAKHKIRSFYAYSSNPLYDADKNQLASEQNRWRRPGDITDVPAYTTSTNSFSSYFFDNQIESGNYMKCTNISLGYNMPQSVCEKLCIERARFNFNIQNPFIFTKYRGIDPETLGAFGYPSARKFILSINIGI